ncbi:MAG: leucyl aminopeptidase [Candidatus Micrarchaeota archaeon]
MALDFSVVKGRLEDQNVDVVVAATWEKTLTPEAKRIDSILGGEISSALEKKEFDGKNASLMVMRTLGKLKQKKVVVVGLGSEKDYKESVLNAFNAAAAAFGVVKYYVESIAFRVSLGDLKSVVQACVLSSYDFQEFKSAGEEKKDVKLKRVVFVLDGAEDKGKAELEIAFAKTVAEAQNFSRVLDNTNPAVATPKYVADQAKKLAGGKLKVSVWGKKELEKKGYNAILSVGKGSVNEPKLVVMEYDGGKKGEKPFAIVGKGVCFDSGGLSLKPAAYMDFMQYDKSGACTVIATMKALKELNLPVNVVGIAPLVENLPSGSAFKPGDIITTASGKTIEITNTDAEGRVVLSDALHHATLFKPKGIIDLATLTGACVVALGHEAAGLMGNDAKLAEKVKKAAAKTGERVWELPMWSEYAELVKSQVADVSNADKDHAAGTIEGGWFLKNFVGETPWVHLDTAGVSWVEKPKLLFRAGSTGWGVRLLVEFFKSE